MRFYIKNIIIFLIVFGCNASYSQCAPKNHAFGCTIQEQERFTQQIINQMRRNVSEQAYLEETERRNNKSVELCYLTLTQDSNESDVSKAIKCLIQNPYAGKQEFEKFESSKSNIYEKFKEIKGIKDEFDKLKVQKQDLYLLLERSDRPSFIYALNKFNTAGFGSINDLWAANPQIIVKSNVTKKDERVNLNEVKSFSVSVTRHKASGVGVFLSAVLADSEHMANDRFFNSFKVELKNGDSFQDDNFIRNDFIVNPEVHEYYAGLYATGKIYVKNPEPFIADTNIIFSLDKLKGENGDFKATIISHVEAQKFIDEARRDVANKNSKEINDKITKEAEISSRRNVVIEKIKSASKGDEDSCQGYKNIRVNLDDVIVKCQILAVKAPLSVFKDNNWLLTNVSSIQQDETGSTVIISIKKAR